MKVALAFTFCVVLAGCDSQPEGRIMEESESEALKPPAKVTEEVFRKWRDARRGSEVAEDLSNPYWAWLIEEDEVSSWAANEHFGGPSSYDGKPAWAWDRFGQSETQLPDGRSVFVAGEHEDHYDPDFFIYNDVVIRSSNGELKILGYPVEDFPPTDFHSATFRNGEIVLVGNLGYPDQRREGITQILILDLTTWRVRHQESSNAGPGWISDHEAELSDDGNSILVKSGNIWTGPEVGLIENIDDWRLDLKTWAWERLTDRKWPLFSFSRADGENSVLWDMRQYIWQQQFAKMDFSEVLKEMDANAQAMIKEAFEYSPPKDAEALELLYKPSTVQHMELPKREEEHSITRIKVEGVTVRYEEDMAGVMMTVEGKLPEPTIDLLRVDLLDKLGRVEGADYKAQRLR